ncbi:MAG: hypothetical protein H6636_07090 [Anaerolineales bacterium]|nr:hypothetical protein [Anaerolineales bacterium]
MFTPKNLKLFVFFTTLILAAMACAIPNLGGNSDGSLYRDDFSNTKTNWGVGTDADSSVEYVSDGLQFFVTTPNYFTWSNPGAETDFENIHVEVTVINRSTDLNAAFGIVCHQQVTDSAHYYFAVTPNQQYAIAKAAVAQSDVFLTNSDQWADSDLIPLNAKSYQIGADCGNGTLTLYVNGQQIATATDTTYTKGEVGLFAWSGEDTAGTTVVFDNFVVTSLGE